MVEEHPVSEEGHEAPHEEAHTVSEVPAPSGKNSKLGVALFAVIIVVLAVFMLWYLKIF